MKILAPEKLATEPNESSAEKHYRHWKRTFENFLQDCGDNAPDKLRCLTRYVSADVFERFADATSYDDAISVLDSLYIRPKNEVFARHQLSIRTEKHNENLREFIQDLHRLAKQIELKDVTAN